jgi:WD40 repeat protein
MRLFDLKSKEMMTHFKEHNGSVTSLDIFGDGQFAITSGRDRSIVVYDLKAERRISVHRERHQGVNALGLFHTNEAVMAVTAADRGLSFWDFRMQEPARTVELKHEVTALATGHAGGVGVTGDVTGVVKLWDFQAGHPVISDYLSPAKHVGEVAAVAVASDARSVVSAGADHSIFVWNIFE